MAGYTPTMPAVSEGRRLLLLHLQTSTRVATVGRLRIKISATAIGYWASGRSTPEYPQRVACRDTLGIPLDAWDQPPLRGKAAALQDAA